MAQHPLAKELTKRSKSGTWAEALREWDFLDVEQNDDGEECLCGHYPIKEVCIIKNHENGNIERVGNCCVKIFIPKSEAIFRAVRALRKDVRSGINLETIEYARERAWINDREHKFSVETFRKRKLSEKQKDWRAKINKKILEKIAKPSQGGEHTRTAS